MNKALAEGRERFRRFLSRSEDGTRCRELRPLLSAFCDGEASAKEAVVVREHLRVCGPCRATMRAYRTAPRAVAALLPIPAGSVAGSLLGRLRDLFAGAKGTATAGMAKGLTVCVGAVGGAACVATGVVPAPFVGSPGDSTRPAREAAAPESSPLAVPRPKAPPRAQQRTPAKRERDRGAEARSVTAQTPAVEYAPPPAAAPAPEPSVPEAEPGPAPEPVREVATPSSSSGGAAGEFGP